MTQKFHSWVYAQGNENICLHQNMDTNGYSNIIHNSQKVETTQMSINLWMDKWSVV